MAAALLISLQATAAQSAAATVYALNCLGCHFPPEEFTREALRALLALGAYRLAHHNQQATR